MMHFQQEMHGVDCAVVDEEEVELLSVTLAATRLVEESQVRGAAEDVSVVHLMRVTVPDSKSWNLTAEEDARAQHGLCICTFQTLWPPQGNTALDMGLHHRPRFYSERARHVDLGYPRVEDDLHDPFHCP